MAPFGDTRGAYICSDSLQLHDETVRLYAALTICAGLFTILYVLEVVYGRISLWIQVSSDVWAHAKSFTMLRFMEEETLNLLILPTIVGDGHRPVTARFQAKRR
jgi:uncharacterized membrane protein YcfT